MKDQRKFGITRPHNTYVTLTKTLDVLIIPLVLFVVVKLNALEWTDHYTWWLLISVTTFQTAIEFNTLQRPKNNILRVPDSISVAITWLCGLSLLFCFNEIASLILANEKKYFWEWIITTPIIMLVWHRLLTKILAVMQKKQVRRVAIVGANELGRYLHNSITEKHVMYADFVGFFDDEITTDVCGNLQQLITETNKGHIDDIYITLPLAAEPKIKELTEQLANSTASVYYIPDLFVFDLLCPTLYSIDGLPVLSIYDTPFNDVEVFMKRAVDVMVSSVILAMIFIPLILIGIAVKISSKGPVLFKQRRYGLEGEEIIVWKFRSMTVCEDGGQINQAVKNDPRVTKLGSFLRRTSLDELPQFINVLQGRMSIVGPRPHAVSHNEWYRTRIKGYMLRHKVKPGITGLAQINSYRGETDTLDKMEGRIYYDLLYIQNWSLWLDMKIILLTPYKCFVSEKAY